MEFDVPKQAFIYAAIHLLANRLQTVGDKLDPSISSKQWFLLVAVSKFTDLKGAPPNIGDIANGLGTSRQNIKKMANLLEQRGFLKLEKDKSDLRSIRLLLTERCEDYFQSREQRDDEYLERIFRGIEEETLVILCKGMGKLIENLDTVLIETQGEEGVVKL